MFARRATPKTRSSPPPSSSTSATSSRASPARSGRRTGCRWREAKEAFLEAMEEFDPEAAEQLGNGSTRRSRSRSPPPTRRPRTTTTSAAGRARRVTGGDRRRRSWRGSEDAIEVTLEDGTAFELDHGRVVIAAITSCTNTSNPSVMVGAGLLARNAVERGLDAQAVGEDLAGAGLDRGHRLPREGRPDRVPRRSSSSTSSATAARPASATPGPLPPEISAAVEEKDLAVCAVLSGNRNFEGRINQDVKANYLASPPLVVAYALAGRMDIDLDQRAARRGLRRRAGLPARHLARRRGDQGGGRQLDRLGDVHPQLRRGARGRRELERGRGPRGRPLHLARLDLRAPPVLLRGDAGRGAGGRADRAAPGCSPCSATRSPPTTSRPPGRSRRTARPAAG